MLVSYCKLIACTIVELWQHKIRISSEWWKIVQIHGSIAPKLKGFPLQKWLAYNLQAFCLDLVMVACL